MLGPIDVDAFQILIEPDVAHLSIFASLGLSFWQDCCHRIVYDNVRLRLGGLVAGVLASEILAAMQQLLKARLVALAIEEGLVEMAV